MFERTGHILGRLADVSALQGGVPTAHVLVGGNMPTNFGTIYADYAAGTPLPQLCDGLGSFLNNWSNAQTQLFQNLALQTRNLIQAMVAIDIFGIPSDAPAATLTGAIQIGPALQVLVGQMIANSATVNASVPTLGNQTAVGSPAGNPVFVGSLLDPQGRTLQYLYPETLTFTCTRDSATGGVAVGSEIFSVTGLPAVQNVYNPLWPGGSGANTSIQLVNSQLNNSGGNVLQNSSFVTATTTNVADNWTNVVGAPSTDIFIDLTTHYKTGSGSLKFVGTGAALLDTVTQAFGTTPSPTVGTGGTNYALLPDTVYVGNVWIKVSATPSAGVAEFALVDSTNTVIADDAGNNNLVTRTLTNISTSFVNFHFVFRTPAVLSLNTPLKLRVRLSTAVDSAKDVWFSDLALTPVPTPIYAGGPPFAGFSGNLRCQDTTVPDTFSFSVGNTWGLFQLWLQRTCNLTQLGIVIPNDVSPSISDALLA